MNERAKLIEVFLRNIGWDAAARSALAGDASNRRYDRLTGGREGRDAVLMDADPASGGDTAPFTQITALLRARGFSAPRILAEDRAAGLLLLEDLGDALYARVCAADPAMERPLYEAAIDALAALGESGPDMGADIPPYDAAALAREAELLTQWWIPGATGAPCPPDLAADYAALIDDACRWIADARTVLTLRDYHAENLIWLPERAGAARVGLLDYQDALIGHPAYDLVSLLEDARRDTSADLRAAMIARYLAAVRRRDPAFDAEAFRAAYAVLGAQRNLKIIGIFARLKMRDGKGAYLNHVPRAWDHLMRDLAHPALASLRGWIAAHVPPPVPATLMRIAGAKT